MSRPGGKRSSPPKKGRERERGAPAQRQEPQNEESRVAFVTITTAATAATAANAANDTWFYVDNRRVGRGTVHESLTPGYHQLEAVHANGSRWQKYLSFEAGDDRQVIIHW